MYSLMSMNQTMFFYHDREENGDGGDFLDDPEHRETGQLVKVEFKKIFVNAPVWQAGVFFHKKPFSLV